MKYLVILLFLPLYSYSQNIPTFKHDYQVFYLNYENRVELNTNQCDVSKILLKATNARIGTTSDTTYYIYPYNIEEEIKLKLYYKSLPVDILTAEVDTIPNPAIVVKDAVNGELPISKIENLLNGVSIVYDENFQLSNHAELYTYTLILSYKEGDPEFFKVFGSNSNQNFQIDKLKNMKAGDKVVISNIQLLNKSNNIRTINATMEIILVPDS